MTDDDSDTEGQEQYGGTQDDDLDAVEQTERRTDDEDGPSAGDGDSDADDAEEG